MPYARVADCINYGRCWLWRYYEDLGLLSRHSITLTWLTDICFNKVSSSWICLNSCIFIQDYGAAIVQVSSFCTIFAKLFGHCRLFLCRYIIFLRGACFIFIFISILVRHWSDSRLKEAQIVLPPVVKVFWEYAFRRFPRTIVSKIWLLFQATEINKHQ